MLLAVSAALVAAFIGVGVFFIMYVGILVGLMAPIVLDSLIFAASRGVALAVDSPGIVLRRGLLLARWPRWGSTVNQTIPWSEVVAVHVGKMPVKDDWIMSDGTMVPWTVAFSMVDVELTDGSHRLRSMQGVVYDSAQLARAVRFFAPGVRVRVVQGRIRPPGRVR